MFGDHLMESTRFSCKIITVEPKTKTIQGVMRGGPIHISQYTQTPFFRWPKVGENWIVKRENGNWYLDSILQNENDVTSVKELNPGDSFVNLGGKILTNSGTSVPQKFTENVKSNSATEFIIKHNLNDSLIQVNAINEKTNEPISISYKYINSNEIKVKLASPPKEGAVIIIIG